MKENLTKREAQEFMRVSRASIDRWMSSGELRYIKLGKKVLFRRKDLDAFLRKHLVKK